MLSGAPHHPSFIARMLSHADCSTLMKKRSLPLVASEKCMLWATGLLSTRVEDGQIRGPPSLLRGTRCAGGAWGPCFGEMLGCTERPPLAPGLFLVPPWAELCLEGLWFHHCKRVAACLKHREAPLGPFREEWQQTDPPREEQSRRDAGLLHE